MSGTARMEARSRLREVRSALGDVLANPNIRQLELAWSAGVAADWTFLVTILVVAYQQGGSLAVGAVGLARMIPATVVALFVTIPARVAHERALIGIYGLRAASAALATVGLLLGQPLWIFLVAAAGVASSGAMVRPTQAGLLPSLARRPEELVASNVGATVGESLGTFIGPAIGGTAALLAGPATATAISAALFLLAVASVARISIPPVAAAIVSPAAGTPTRPPVVNGFRALVEHRSTGLVIVGLACQVLVRGLLTTLIVVASIELLGLGEGGVGGLNAAIGAGGLLGGLVALGLATRGGIARIYLFALAAWGIPIAVVGLVPLGSVAVVAMGILGVSNAVLDISAFTLLQRTLPNNQRSAVLGFLEGIIGVGIALGGILAPALIAGLGIRAALVVTGAILPVAALLTRSPVLRADSQTVLPERELRLLRGVPMFGLLPLTMLERLASGLAPVSVAAGETLIQEGEVGDRFFIVEDGRLQVTARGRALGVSGPGDGIGEIALLRRVPRTATVTAVDDSHLYALEGGDFLAVIGEHLGNAAAADVLIAERVARSESAAH